MPDWLLSRLDRILRSSTTPTETAIRNILFFNKGVRRYERIVLWIK